MRPKTYQQPHPPLIRASISMDSMLEMARRGRPVLTGVDSVEDTAERLKLYQETMYEAGFDEAHVKWCMSETWVRRSVYVAESNEQALEEAVPAFQAERAHISEARQKLNPKKYVDPIPTPPSISSMPEHYLLAGTPGYVAEKIAELRDVGAKNVLLGMSPSHMARDRVQNSMKLFAEEVAPLFRGD